MAFSYELNGTGIFQIGLNWGRGLFQMSWVGMAFSYELNGTGIFQIGLNGNGFFKWVELRTKLFRLNWMKTRFFDWIKWKFDCFIWIVWERLSDVLYVEWKGLFQMSWVRTIISYRLKENGYFNWLECERLFQMSWNGNGLFHIDWVRRAFLYELKWQRLFQMSWVGRTAFSSELNENGFFDRVE